MKISFYDPLVKIAGADAFIPKSSFGKKNMKNCNK